MSLRKSLLAILIASALFANLLSCAHHPAAPEAESVGSATEAVGSYHGTEIDIVSRMGSETSYFVRRPVPSDDLVMASQLRLKSGSHPSVTTSWPAGNSGIFLELKNPDSPSGLLITAEMHPSPVSRPDGQRGVRVLLHLSNPDAATTLTAQAQARPPVAALIAPPATPALTPTPPERAPGTGEQ